MIRQVAAIVWLAVIWVALWGTPSPANILGGLLVAFFVLTIVPLHRPGPTVGARPLIAVRLVFYVLWKMIEASISVAWEVLSPGRARSAIIAVPIRGASPAVISASCIAIGLTPGTMVVEVRREPPTLYVHVLRMTTVDQARSDVLHLERLIEEALPASNEVPS